MEKLVAAANSKHAYLVMAHNNWDTVKTLLQLLDHPRNDIFMHIDRKAADFPLEELTCGIQYSQVHFYKEIDVRWGGYSQIETELFLLRMATSKGTYAFYHILSGSDLPLCTPERIHEFFDCHTEENFIHVVPVTRCSKEIQRRAKYYHFFVRKSLKYQWMYTFLHRMLLVPQILIGVNRSRNMKIYYGSNWASLTHAFARYLLDNEQYIQKTFRHVNSCDDLYKQTLIKMGKFKIYSESPKTTVSVLRYIDFSAGGASPKTLTLDDAEAIMGSNAFFARKFDAQKDQRIINKVVESIKG